MKKTVFLSIVLLGFYSLNAQWTTGNDIYNTNSGNVGIGTSAPLTKLHVEGQLFQNGDIRLGQQKDDVGYGKRLTFDDNGNYDALWISRYNAASDASELRMNIGDDGLWLDKLEIGYSHWQTGTWTPKFSFIADGRLGIGTTDPGSYKLAVEGKIGAREIKVTLENPWADYVFNKNYRLRSLASLEKYINQYQHLPGLPSAEEVNKNGGIELGEMNRKLVEKIEELTLYVIEMKKEIKDLQSENKQLKARISTPGKQ